MSVVAVSAGESASSKTRALASLAVDLAGAGTLVDLHDLPADGLLGRVAVSAVDEAVALASSASVLVVATPVYRATYTGALKAFFDRFQPDALRSTACVLCATAAVREHFLAVDTGLRVLVASLGGWSVPSVVYATGADFVEGVLSAGVADSLRRALDEATRIAGALR